MPNLRPRTLFVFGVAAILSGVAGRSQDGTSVPADSRVDVRRVFYASPSDADAAEAALEKSLSALESLRGKLSSSGRTLLEALRLRTEISRQFEKLEAYFYLRWAGNTVDRAMLDRDRRLTADVNARMSFLANEVAKIHGARLAAFAGNAPGLSQYNFAISQMRRFNDHRGSADVEAVLSKLEPQLSGWQDSLYEQVLASTAFEPMLVDGSSLSPYRDRGSLAVHTDPVIRKEAFQRLYGGLANSRGLVAFVLQKLALAGNARAAIHNYQTAADEYYAFRFLSKAEVQGLLRQIAASSDLYKNIEREKADRLGKALGLSEIHYWDLAAPVRGATPTFSLAEARRVVLAAVAPLGEDYQREMSALLDPLNGRFDVSNGGNRKSGGFSLGFPSFPSVFFAGQFRGTYNDVRVMTHESGHAVHRELMRSAGVLPDYTRGPNYLFESFASLNELLLADYLHDRAADPAERRYYLQQFLDGKATAAFYVAPEAELEQAVYERAKNNQTLTPDLLDEMTLEIYSKYSIWPPVTPELKRQWQLVPLMYEDPFYDLNYVYAGLLALKYYDLLHADPASFRASFTAMLKNGFDAPPDQLLSRFLSIDVRSPELVTDGQRTLAARLQQLKDR